MLISGKKALIIKVKPPVSLNNSEIRKTLLENSKKAEIIFLKSKHFHIFEPDFIKFLNKTQKEDFLEEIKNNPKKRKELEKEFPEFTKKCQKENLYSNIAEKIIIPNFTRCFLNPFVKGEEYKIGEARIIISENTYSVLPPEIFLNKQELKEIEEVLKNIDSLSIKEIKSLNLSPKIKEIILRNTIGFGVLEILFKDHNLQDIYINAPKNNIHVFHSKKEGLNTNITLSKKEIEKLKTKIRLDSGRPFDASNPKIDAEIKEHKIRVCAVTEPMTKETAFAFRKHSTNPWTLLKLIKNNTIDETTAGLLSFLADSSCSILISGHRSAGKTSMLSALINEIDIKNRIIAIEDTKEIPFDNLIRLGYNIQHIKTRSAVSENKFEVTPKEALRTALRLGESVLVIGEVRSTEAKALFEAMRIGSSGSAVLGTIHASNEYDTFDRVVNDLEVKRNSFKAIDIIISMQARSKGEFDCRERKLITISEVKKNWDKKPEFMKLIEYKNGKWILSKNFEKSELLKKLAEKKGISIKELKNSIETRKKAKELILKKNDDSLLELGFSVKSSQKLKELLLKTKNSRKALEEFGRWLK